MLWSEACAAFETDGDVDYDIVADAGVDADGVAGFRVVEVADSIELPPPQPSRHMDDSMAHGHDEPDDDVMDVMCDGYCSNTD